MSWGTGNWLWVEKELSPEMESGVSLSLSFCKPFPHFVFFCHFFEDSQPENTVEKIITQREPVKLINFPFTSGTFMSHFQVFFLLLFVEICCALVSILRTSWDRMSVWKNVRGSGSFSQNDKNKLTSEYLARTANGSEMREKFPSKNSKCHPWNPPFVMSQMTH